MRGEFPTEYKVEAVHGKIAVEAKVANSFALLLRPISIDLTRTPVMCWQWFVDSPIARADMTKKAGDDYAARIYVGFDMPDSAMSAATRVKIDMARRFFNKDFPDAAVVYVWDNKHAVGTARKSSYTDRSQLVVAESGAGRARKWIVERADVAADFAKAFQNKPGKPIQLAIAADGDNTKSSGRAAFAGIHFVARGDPCTD